MSSRPPPRFVVRRQDDAGHRHRWLWLGAAWLASVLLAGWLAGLMTRHGVPAVRDQHEHRALDAQIDDLKQQLANARRDAQVDDVATRALRGTLAQREEEINGLRADLDFYARLVGGDAQREGLKVQEVKLQPITGSHGWNLSLSLTQNAKRGDETAGNASVSVEGLRGNKVVTLDWRALGNATQATGLPFRFSYFEQLHGTLVLPADFRPTRLRVLVQPASGEAVTRVIAWGAALGADTTMAQGDQDAQP